MEKKRVYKRGRAFSSGTFTALLALAAVAVVVVLNLLVSMLPASATKIDITQNDLYKIGSITKDYLDTVQDAVTVYLVAETGDEDTSLVEFIRRYESYCPSISFKTVDPVLQPSFVSGYTSDTLSANSLVVVSEKRHTVVAYSEIYTYDYEYNSESGQYVVTAIYFAGENALTSAIKYVTSDELPTVAFTSGHGETQLSDTYLSYLSLESISVEYISLMSLGKVPGDVSCLVICGPQSDINAYEAAMVLNYLEAGGSLVLLTDYTGTERPNLLSLTEYYGLTTSQGVVFDGNTDYCYKYEYYLFPDMTEHEITEPLLESGFPVAMLYAHEIHTLELYRDTIEVLPLLTSSESAWTKKLTSADESYDRTDSDPAGSFSIGVYAQEEHDGVLTRLLWYGCTSMVNDSADTLVSGANSDLFINSLAYLCDYNSAISIHSKDITVSTLAMTSAQITFWTVIVSIIAPAVAIGAGLFVWLKRRAG